MIAMPAELLVNDAPTVARLRRAIDRYEALTVAAREHGVDRLSGLIEDADQELLSALVCVEEFLP